MIDVKTFVVMNGSVIDTDASVEKFKDHLNFIASQNSASSDKFLGMLNEFFDKNPKFVKKSSLIDFIVSKHCGDDVSKFSDTQKAFTSWLNDNTCAKREEGKLFAFKRGIGGGINRWSNIKEKEVNEG